MSDWRNRRPAPGYIVLQPVPASRTYRLIMPIAIEGGRFAQNVAVSFSRSRSWLAGEKLNSAILDGELAIVDELFEVVARWSLRLNAILRHGDFGDPGSRIDEQGAHAIVREV